MKNPLPRTFKTKFTLKESPVSWNNIRAAATFKNAVLLEDYQLNLLCGVPQSGIRIIRRGDVTAFALIGLTPTD
jgi:hypothetical protein